MCTHTVTTLLGTRCAAVTHPDCKSELKYSTVYPMNEVPPCFCCTLFHAKVTLELVMFTNFGSLGDDGNMLMSGVRCSALVALFSTWLKMRNSNQKLICEAQHWAAREKGFSPLSTHSEKSFNLNCKFSPLARHHQVTHREPRRPWSLSALGSGSARIHAGIFEM